VQRAGDTNAALALIQKGVEPELHELLGAEEAEAFDKSVLKHIVGAHIAKKILTKDDLYGALACFWLVFVSCLPAAILCPRRIFFRCGNTRRGFFLQLVRAELFSNRLV
jgi:hypothetical protein